MFQGYISKFQSFIFSFGYHHNRQKSSSSTSINRYYQALVHDIEGKPFKETITSSQKLKIMLNKKYEKQIKIEKQKTILGNIVYCSLMTSEEALRKHQR